MDFNNIPVSGGKWDNLSTLLNYNFNKIGLETAKARGVIGTYRGLYKTEAILKQSNPNPEFGEYAFVFKSGVTSETVFILYYANENQIWTRLEEYSLQIDPDEYIKPEITTIPEFINIIRGD